MSKSAREKLESKFAKMLTVSGFNFVSGVPCGVQKYIIAFFSNNSKIKHVAAVRESEAIGIAAGAYLAGKNPVAYMQNSGLMDSINDITSLLISYKIPLLLLVSWRGAPGEDASQHLINGKSTKKILNSIGVPVFLLNSENMESVINSAKQYLNKKQTPAVILIRRGVLR